MPLAHCILCQRRVPNASTEYGKLECAFHPMPPSDSEGRYGVPRGTYPCCGVVAGGFEERNAARLDRPVGCTPIDHVFSVAERADVERHGTGVVRLRDAVGCASLCKTVSEQYVDWNAPRTEFLDAADVPYAVAFANASCLRGDVELEWTDSKGKRIASASVAELYKKIVGPVDPKAKAAAKSLNLERASSLYDVEVFESRSEVAFSEKEQLSREAASFVPFVAIRRIGPKPRRQ
jgi:hypothetical protein